MTLLSQVKLVELINRESVHSTRGNDSDIANAIKCLDGNMYLISIYLPESKHLQILDAFEQSQ